MALAEDLTSTVFLKALCWLQQERGPRAYGAGSMSWRDTTIADYWHTYGMWEIVSLDEVEDMSVPEEGTAEEREEGVARARSGACCAGFLSASGRC